MPSSKSDTKRTQRTASILDVMGETGLSEDTVRRDLRRGCPHSREGREYRLNVPEYRQWRESKGLRDEKGRPPETPDSPDLEKARLRKENALAAKYELQVKRERAELVPLEEVKRWIAEKVLTAKHKLVGFPAGVTPLLEGRDAAERQSIMEDRMDEILTELSTGEPGTA